MTDLLSRTRAVAGLLTSGLSRTHQRRQKVDISSESRVFTSQLITGKPCVVSIIRQRKAQCNLSNDSLLLSVWAPCENYEYSYSSQQWHISTQVKYKLTFFLLFLKMHATLPGKTVTESDRSSNTGKDSHRKGAIFKHMYCKDATRTYIARSLQHQTCSSLKY